MYQRSPANSASAAAPIPAVDVVDVWNGSATPHWLDIARQVLSLPTTWRGFTLFLLGLLLIAAATAMQVYLSAQILEAQVEINAMRAELDGVERVNAEVAWQIAILSRMENIAARARAQGFHPVVEPIYVPRDNTVVNAAAIDPPGPFYVEQFDTGAVPEIGSEIGVATEGWRSSANERTRLGIERARTWSSQELDRRLETIQGWLQNQ